MIENLDLSTPNNKSLTELERMEIKINEVIDEINSLRDDANTLMGYIAPEDGSEPKLDSLHLDKSIWHKYNIKDQPERSKEVLTYNNKDKRHKICFIDHEDWIHGFYGWIERWAYLDNIVSKANRVERLEKAIEVALISLGTASILDKKHIKRYTNAKIDLIKCLIKG